MLVNINVWYKVAEIDIMHSLCAIHVWYFDDMQTILVVCVWFPMTYDACVCFWYLP